MAAKKKATLKQKRKKRKYTKKSAYWKNPTKIHKKKNKKKGKVKNGKRS